MTIQKKPRLANMELLRFMAMFMILTLHADYFCFGWPQRQDILTLPEVWGVRILVEHWAIIGVDVFILISGWFGIRTSLKGACKLLFQVFFIGLLTSGTVLLLKGMPSGGVVAVLKSLISFWFVWSYLLLYLFAPALNTFVETAGKQQLKGFLIAFFTFATLDLAAHFSDDFRWGYSAIFFMGLYVLARYVRLHVDYKALRTRTLVIVYAACLLIPAFFTFASASWLPQIFYQIAKTFFLTYSFLINILEAIVLLILFDRLQLRPILSRPINWLAAGAFTVYLVHQNTLVRPLYAQWVKDIDTSLPFGLNFLGVALMLCAVYLACTLLDQLRVAAWQSGEKLWGKYRKK